MPFIFIHINHTATELWCPDWIRFHSGESIELFQLELTVITQTYFFLSDKLNLSQLAISRDSMISWANGRLRRGKWGQVWCYKIKWEIYSDVWKSLIFYKISEIPTGELTKLFCVTYGGKTVICCQLHMFSKAQRNLGFAQWLQFSAQVLSSQEVLYEIRFAVLHITSAII